MTSSAALAAIMATLSAPLWILAALVAVQAVRETRMWRRAALSRPQLVWSRRGQKESK